MKNSIRLKLENLKDRFDELEALLSDADVISDQNQFRELSKEYAELEEVDEVDLNKGDLRIDTFRASGAGGQHVNKTDSAIRITHLPTGIVVECQDERSQHKNKARAMSLLQAKLLDQAQAEQQQEESDARRKLVGSGDRSEKIRTYNYPQGRVTDHRIKLTLYNLTEIMAGELGSVVQPLINEYQADLLASLAAED